MLSSDEINTLGQLLNTTWGSSFSAGSTSWPRGTTTPLSIKGSLVTAADGTTKLAITYTDFATLGGHQEIIATKKRLHSIAEKACLSFIKNLKKEFKGTCARALKMKFVYDQDDVETIYSPVPEVSLIAVPRYRPPVYRGYYRYTTVYDIA